jgi:hypothetical protein
MARVLMCGVVHGSASARDERSRLKYLGRTGTFSSHSLPQVAPHMALFFCKDLDVLTKGTIEVKVLLDCHLLNTLIVILIARVQDATHTKLPEALTD